MPAEFTNQSKDEPEPFDQLVIDHQAALYAFIRSMIFNPQDARDTLQDVNIILYRKQEAFIPGTNFKAWAFTVARFECLNYLSRHKKTQWTTLDTGLLESLADMAEEETHDIQPWLAALKQCVQILPENAQQLIDKRYRQQIPMEHTAVTENLSIPALKQKLYRVRNRLRKCILTRLEEQKNSTNSP
ncbi:sigma-70 family RNA polymerase sigma factor [Verrucomicrobiaceae bacterium N1E253]|uniref:Sigma-70 family RNA polymerase sigma factor n=1 Tax=Oceaniferula marina TaxID=2748318 RepID=A0A851GMP2_9BACT|nr:sigma-70 family RNA polymerase sigma factor [Oceaniferula marina]NWK55374.1 sigma-70 family RNA polymerase sigma factor [Oceaniferula marina]